MKKQKIPQPIKNFVLIEKEKVKLAGGIIDPTDRDVELGEVLAIGDEVEKVKKGDRIIFKSYNLFTVEISKDEEYNFLQEDEILAVF